MSEPEIRFVVDEYRRIGYRVTNEGVLLSKDEKEFIASHILHLQADNAKLRELIGMIGNVCDGTSEVCEHCKNYSATNDECMMLKQMQELGIEV